MNFNRKSGNNNNRNAVKQTGDRSEKEIRGFAPNGQTVSPDMYPGGAFPSLEHFYPQGNTESVSEPIVSNAYDSERGLQHYDANDYNRESLGVDDESRLGEFYNFADNYHDGQQAFGNGFFIPEEEEIPHDDALYSYAGSDNGALTRGKPKMTDKRFPENNREQRLDRQRGGNVPHSKPEEEDNLLSQMPPQHNLNEPAFLQSASFDPSDYDDSPYYEQLKEPEYAERQGFVNQQNASGDSFERRGVERSHNDQSFYGAGYNDRQNIPPQSEDNAAHQYYPNPSNQQNIADNRAYDNPAYEHGGADYGVLQDNDHAYQPTSEADIAQRGNYYANNDGEKDSYSPDFSERSGNYYPHEPKSAVTAGNMPLSDVEYGNHHYDGRAVSRGEVSQPSSPRAAYAPPFVNYENESQALADDFSHLNTDIEKINTAAAAGEIGKGRDDSHNAREFRRQQYENKGRASFDLRQPAYDTGLTVSASKDKKSNQAVKREAKLQQPNSDTVVYDDVYDWSENPATADIQTQAQQSGVVSQKSATKNIIFLAVFAGVLGIGIILYWFFGNPPVISGKEPPIIRNTSGSYKARPKEHSANPAAVDERSIYDGMDSNGTGNSDPGVLRDDAEQPLEKIEDRLPFSREENFDQSSVESLIKSALVQAAPIHIVPSVRVDIDRKILASAGANDAETVLRPGESVMQAQGNYIKKAAVNDMNATAPPVLNMAGGILRGGVKNGDPVFSAGVGGAVSGGDFYMQISSQPTKEAAEQSMYAAKKYLSSDIAGKMVVVPAVIPDKGTYYRVRIPAESREEAVRLCEEYKQAGGQCFVAR